jgi:hypothetical protein
MAPADLAGTEKAIGEFSGADEVAARFPAQDARRRRKFPEYVKICSLYGAGYYYIPGTDICLRVGGYVRQEWTYGFGASISTGPWNAASAAHSWTSGTADLVWRTRAYVNIESRQQTAYGTLRTYFNMGVSGNNSVDLNANRAFIQLAGFTVGRATSYFDHYSGAAVAYLVDLSSDSGDGGREVFAYTAQLGNGVSASISLENAVSHRYDVYLGGAAFPSSNRRKIVAPDVVGNVRVDQAWGSAQVMAAAHEASGGFYVPALSGVGHPGEKWGWAVGAGIKVNTPFVSPGDFFAAQFAYSEGALKYICNHPGCGFDFEYEGGGGFGYGYWTDAVYSPVPGSPLELTTAWGVAAAYEHFWTPSLRTSVHGGYTKVEYNTAANTILCGALGVAPGPCNNDFARWQIGSRTQWNVTKQFYMGFDVVYQTLETASAGAVAVIPALDGHPAGARLIQDQDNLAVRWRWHRDLP